MDEKEFKERSVRLQEVGEVIEKLPAEIRGEAFKLLGGYVTGLTVTPAQEPDSSAPLESDEDVSLFTQFTHDKPSDNARLIAAHLYREFGSEPFSVDEIKAVATDVGITVPDRVDMTLAAAQENEKHLFAKAGRGKFRPTVHGEAYLKATYKVKKGTKKRGPGSAEAP